MIFYLYFLNPDSQIDATVLMVYPQPQTQCLFYGMKSIHSSDRSSKLRWDTDRGEIRNTQQSLSDPDFSCYVGRSLLMKILNFLADTIFSTSVLPACGCCDVPKEAETNYTLFLRQAELVSQRIRASLMPRVTTGCTGII